MNLYWTKLGIPHGFLGENPIHLIYRVKDCAPVGLLRELSADLKSRVDVLRKLENTPSVRIQEALEEWLETYDQLLDAQDQKVFVLSNPKAAQEVIDSWLHMKNRGDVQIYVICVMGNHVHVLLRGPNDKPETQIGKTVRLHKSFTDKMIREKCDVSDKIWDDGFYDRYVRLGAFWEVLVYILQNPVKAGLVSNWLDWTHTYIDPRCVVEGERLGVL